jgi:phosphatidylinositol glycan class A protein
VTMSTVGAAICVSKVCRENYILRANVRPSIVHVIPNAVDSTRFTPQPSTYCSDSSKVTVVVVSRLVYRKGVDLLVGIIPAICQAYPEVNFLIGGDGSKKSSLEEMVEREGLQDRVEFLGFLPHRDVCDVLVRGQIFLNCSLTESFCIAILEAASAGLFVVSTNVGGVPEVLPSDMVVLADPSVDSLVKGLSTAITEKIASVDPFEFHQRVRDMYSWERVAVATTKVYDEVLKKPRLTFLQRLARYKGVGGIAGYVVCLLAITLHFVVSLVEWWQPHYLIDVVPDILCDSYENKSKRK